MDGVIIINKPKGITSNAVVQRVRKALGTKQVGHCGTLDPLATGVLPILIGQGTKISKYLVEHDKTYIAILKLGEKTDTADSEGQVIQTKAIPNIDEKAIIKILDNFIGNQEQIPPMYSAIKVDGKKLYEYARSGEEVELKPRQIEIKEIKLLDYDEKDGTIKFEVTCSKGTYIRTLCENIAEKSGTVGYMKELTRTRVNDFNIEMAISLEELETRKGNIPYISIEKIFRKSEEIELDNRKLELFLNGVILTLKKKDGTYRIYSKNKFIGLGIIKNNLLKRDVII